LGIFGWKKPKSQKGRTIIVTGGAAGIGCAIAHSFALASADQVIILGRRLEVVAKAADSLHAIFPSSFQG
jgi:short-subunit dehydrogenase involved in D-alanine esterification of teichoic acids